MPPGPQCLNVVHRFSRYILDGYHPAMFGPCDLVPLVSGPGTPGDMFDYNKGFLAYWQGIYPVG